MDKDYNSSESSASTHICKLPSRYNLAYSKGSSTANEVKKVQSNLFMTSISELCFYTDDIDTVYKKLIEKNVECLSEPQYFDFSSQGFGKSKAFYFKDPDGIILEMMQPL